MGAFKQSLRRARALRPSRIRQDALRPFQLELIAADGADHEALSRVFIPDTLAGHQRAQAIAYLAGDLIGDDDLPSWRQLGDALSASGRPLPGVEARPPSDQRERPRQKVASHLIRVCSPRVTGLAMAPVVAVDWHDPKPGLYALLRACPQHRLALARVFPPLRPLLAHELIHAVAARNAALAAISALPEVIPTPLSLALALGEMGSDTVLLTANQIGLCFELAALRDQDVSWRAQLRPIAAILASSLGWRTLARELVGLIPAGFGLAAKSAIAYSGTVAVGRTLWRVPVSATTGRPVPKPLTLPRQLASRP